MEGHKSLSVIGKAARITVRPRQPTLCGAPEIPEHVTAALKTARLRAHAFGRLPPLNYRRLLLFARLAGGRL